MSQLKATPGPWSFVAETDASNMLHSVYGADEGGDGGLLVARCDQNGEHTDDVRLIAAAPDYAVACGADLHPGEAQSCGPLAWLRSAIDTLDETDVRKVAFGEDGDPDAYSTMMTECRLLLEKLEAANAKARGQ